MIWLHIGTKKTGTTALQHYLSSQSKTVKNHGVTYICPKRKSSCNALAVALNRNRVEQSDAIGAYLSQQIDACTTENAILSSEMLYGIEPEQVFSAVPALRDASISVLVYLRRQDQYLESSYLQKLKNGRFKGTIQDYLQRFDGSGADYWAHLKSWQSCENATLVPRISEANRLTGGTIVQDACDLLGLPPPEAQDRVVNASPSMARVQLLETLAELPGLRLRAIQRTLARDHPIDPSHKAVFFTPEERKQIVESYADSNEKLRAAYFPELPYLFGSEGLDTDPAADAKTLFSDAQLAEVSALLQALHKVHLR